MSQSGSDAADEPGEMTPAPGADLSEGPDTDVFVVRAASAPERVIHSDRGGDHVFRFLATTVETAGRYSFLDHDVPVGGGPLPHVHEKADEWFYVLQGNPVVHVDGHTFTLAEGDFVHIPMGTTHWFEVLDAPIRVLAGYCPAGEELAFM
jgi:mannose-6-phosphate isomerase-like protein (cupin superfamily)